MQIYAPDLYKRIISLVESNESENKIELLSLYYCELLRRYQEKGKSKYLKKVENFLEVENVIPIKWYTRGLDALSELKSKTKGKKRKRHYLYCILFDGFVKSSPYAVYVGENSKLPE